METKTMTQLLLHSFTGRHLRIIDWRRGLPLADDWILCLEHVVGCLWVARLQRRLSNESERDSPLERPECRAWRWSRPSRRCQVHVFLRSGGVSQTIYALGACHKPTLLKPNSGPLFIMDLKKWASHIYDSFDLIMTLISSSTRKLTADRRRITPAEGQAHAGHRCLSK